MATALPPSSRALYFRLLTYVRPYWRVLAGGLVATSLAAATEPMFPALLKPLLDNGFASDTGYKPLTVAAMIIGIFVLRGGVSFLASYAMSWVQNRIITDIRQEIFARFMRLPAGYFNQNPSAQLITKVTYDVNNIAGATTTVGTVLIRDSLVVVGLLGWLLYINWQLTLITLLVGPLIAIFTRLLAKRLRTMSRATQLGMSVMTETLQEAISCQKIIKVFRGETQEEERFARVNHALRGYGMRQGIAAAATTPAVHLIASFAVAIVVYIAMVQSQQGQTTVGSFVSFITAMLMLLAPIKQLANVNAPLQTGLAAAESIFRVLDETPEADLGQTVLARAKGRIELDRLHFRYPKAERDALDGISLDIAPGQTVALVGTSGGGKTTLANLIPRFYTPTAGRLLIDGHDAQDITLASLREQIAIVSQEIVLFNDTVAANIAYGISRNAPRDAIEAAAASANALDFIRALPEGFDTLIGENGSRLSGGQRQRIAIARAILKDAPILILDEATSALDNESERQVQAALETLMQGRTTIVIAHRLSTIERADRIVVLQHGRIVESGAHRDLLAQDGVYAQLYKLQFSEPGGNHA
ncbi:lipid A export permease/ATP-binding protein MsbA [Propionivibrio dicarboxylicus]|uniref:ATP-binding cassette, subfamily B, MsbA n=1 Tax=Propionivibrio dicarboxylicus TaxID=83767 RepID=A0A1G8KZU5_9RHOO|nr:lipid A export permease/ATP-binding protein MsbA [Propionivibrio dicarboxylicus]SDI48954.1 ATP-binding cassette, subfamily B, MsbA [Propionivibrio dicarboxylicus]